MSPGSRSLDVSESKLLAVPDGDVAGLIAAINTANAAPGVDTINLAVNGTYTLTTVDNYWYGPNGLPAITSEIVIEGQGALIQRDPAAPAMSFFYLAGGPTTFLAAETLTLKNLTLSNGHQQGDIPVRVGAEPVFLLTRAEVLARRAVETVGPAASAPAGLAV